MATRAVQVTADSNHTDVYELKGFSIRESAGTPAAAVFRLRDGAVGGDILLTMPLAASQGVFVLFDQGEEIVVPSNGLYVEVVSGTIEGALYYKDD